MLYRILKPIVRLALFFFCRKLIINKPGLLRSEGPLLLACNHPNSFLDSVILDIIFKQPVWSLARGDVFRSSLSRRLLASLKILPVYRTSEGVENLTTNYQTFETCIGIFRENGIVQIFSEGKCINEWHLRPLKKGTARLAIKAWDENIPLKILPVGINYSSFRRFGKNIFLHFGNNITKNDFDHKLADGQRHSLFNQSLQEELQNLVWEIPKNDRSEQERLLTINQSPLKRIVLFLPSLLGWLIHAPLYVPVKYFVWKKAGHTDHFDSILISGIIISYPFYLSLITLFATVWLSNYWLLTLFIIIPFTAWAHLQLKKQLDDEERVMSNE